VATPGTRALTVADGDEDTRLDHWLAREMSDLSRSQIQRLIHDAHVEVSGRKPPIKPGYRVSVGDVITVTIPPPAPMVPVAEDLPLGILYNDADVVVINKPAGMVVHPAVGHAGGTLVNALLHHVRGLSGAGGDDRPGIVHRLDKGTSGVMVVAKNDAAHRELARQFHDREVTKDYIALVWGAMKPGQTMDRAIGRDPRHRTKMSSRGSHTRAAITTVIDVETLRGVSLATVRIGTGRTHQIRVHLSEAGHAIIGDDTYNGVKHHPPTHLKAVSQLKRPFLHAWRLTFAHPSTGEVMTFEAPMPDDLSALLAQLRDPETKART
jgi:23S rRNA pseudouridine1911/1915/1917 synthase